MQRKDPGASNRRKEESTKGVFEKSHTKQQNTIYATAQQQRVGWKGWEYDGN